MIVLYKNEKGSVVKKRNGYYVKIKGKEYFIGNLLNIGFMNDFGYSALIDIHEKRIGTEENLESIKFSDF